MNCGSLRRGGNSNDASCGCGFLVLRYGQTLVLVKLKLSTEVVVLVADGLVHDIQQFGLRDNIVLDIFKVNQLEPLRPSVAPLTRLVIAARLWGLRSATCGLDKLDEKMYLASIQSIPLEGTESVRALWTYHIGVSP